MRLVVVKDKKEMNAFVGDMIAEVIRAKPEACLGLATGSTPEGVYEYLSELYRSGKLDFSRVSSVNLDEYIGLPKGSPHSYAHYMETKLFGNINIDRNNAYVPCGYGNIREETERFNSILQKKPRDIQLLGVGSNGHIGFNEPSRALHSLAHVVTLKEKTRFDNSRFFGSIDEVPAQAITMGLRGILGAEKVVLAASGRYKKDAIQAMVANDEITTDVPCTFLKMHIDFTLVVDEELAGIRS